MVFVDRWDHGVGYLTTQYDQHVAYLSTQSDQQNCDVKTCSLYGYSKSVKEGADHKMGGKGGVNHISPDFVNVGNIEKNLASMLSTFCPRIFFNLY